MEEIYPIGSRPRPVSRSSLERLHAGVVNTPDEIRRALTNLQEAKVVLRRGVNRRIEAETAEIEGISTDEVVLKTENFETDRTPTGSTLFLNASLDGLPLFFVVPVLKVRKAGRLIVGLPNVIYRAERRDRARRLPVDDECPKRVLAEFHLGEPAEGRVADFSADGLAIVVINDPQRQRGDSLKIQFLDGSRAGESLYARIRNLAEQEQIPGWQRLGMSVSRTPFSEPLRAEHRNRILDDGPMKRASRQWKMLSSSIGIPRSFRFSRQSTKSPVRRSDRVELIDFENDRGEGIRAIINSSGAYEHATAVVIPPAWGKTKETLLPLAATIVETFERAREPVFVIRYDGIRKRGESYNERECRFPGQEHHRFTFSQGVRDIQATLDLLERPGFRPARTILVSFSAAAIEGRRAVALEPGRISGWISVVGAADIQSAMRVVSGGVDYLGGAERGVTFGIQEVQGVSVDMDYAAEDAIANGLAFLEDARQDMARITTPISWLHGRFDAWMDLARVQALLGVGSQADRKLMIVPTGHQLRSSAEALQVFQLIASEVGRLSLGRTLTPGLPDLRLLKASSTAERQRLPHVAVNLREFWRDYLLGRNGQMGIELMTATRAYGELMKQQIELLAINAGDSIADLGSGTGSLLAELLESPRTPRGISVNQVDYVIDALARTRVRFTAGVSQASVRTNYVSANLELLGSNPWIPLSDESQSAVLASLLVSYVRRPEALIREVFRVLKPGGRFVLSALRPDADTSRIFMAGSDELRRGRAREVFGRMKSASLEESLRSFLNDAARLLEMEERGVFQFWPEERMAALLKQGGFRRVHLQSGFGAPPQAIVAVAQKPL